MRGGSLPDVPLDETGLVADERAEEALALDEALSGLAALDARQGDVVELRYFVGLTIAEAVDVLNPSPATIKREWTAACAQFHREMSRAL